MTAEQLEELLGRSLYSDEDLRQLSMLAPSLARRVIAAEKLVEELEQTDEGEISGDLYWALQAYREASK